MRARESRPNPVEAAPEAFGGADSNVTSSGAARKSAAPAASTVKGRTFNEIVTTATAEYLASLDRSALPSPLDLEKELMAETNMNIAAENAMRGKDGDRLPLLPSLTKSQIARAMVELHDVVRIIAEPGPDGRRSQHDPLGIYLPERGVYSIDADEIEEVARSYCPEMTSQLLKDVLKIARSMARRVRRNTDDRWVAVANGDVDRNTGELHAFSPDRVFMTRLDLPYVADAQSPVIVAEDGSEWDVDSWLLEVACGDEDLLTMLWQVLSAVAQPQIQTNKAVGLYDRRGNNAKGSFLVVARGLAGQGNHLDASLAELSKDATAPLIAGKSLITSDENATNDFVKNSEMVKKLATRDPILVNPKYQQPFNTAFEGNQIHCFNELLRVGDGTGSQWRRWVFVPFMAHFEGVEKTYIKQDYLRRPEVLTYVLRKALQLKWDGKYLETDAMKVLLNRMRTANDSARQFWDVHRDQFTWDLLPMEFLYELYKAWFDNDKPTGIKLEKVKFVDSLRDYLDELSDGEWVALGSAEKKKAGRRMIVPEPLTSAYSISGQKHDLSRWAGPVADGQRQFRGAVFRDRVAGALRDASAGDSVGQQGAGVAPAVMEPAAAAALRPTGDDPHAQLREVTRLKSDDDELWIRRAIEDDGVVDHAHARAHAEIRKTGHGCGHCVEQGRSLRQTQYPPEEYERSARLAMAFTEARDRVKGVL